jgi:SAM-dependent methyltransferase
MNSLLRGVVRTVADTFPLPGPILEIGSYLVAGQGGLGDLRGLFPGRQYVGLDVRPGPGVDLVGDAERLPLADGSVGSVLAVCTFEHVRRFWRAIAEVRRVLRPDGAFLVACPFYFPIHEYPRDYWRFTPDALALLLDDYPSLLLGWHGPEKRPGHVWALACREGRPPISAAEHRAYEARLAVQARQPLPWLRRLRYSLGRWLCGRRPFAPWLERERCRSRCLNRPRPALRSGGPLGRLDAVWRQAPAQLLPLGSDGGGA